MYTKIVTDTRGRCKEKSILFYYILLEIASLTELWIQDLFTDTERLGSDLQKLVGIDKFQSLLKAQYLGRR